MRPVLAAACLALVLLSFIFPLSVQADSSNYVTKQDVIIRNGPGESFDQVGTLPKGVNVVVYGLVMGWFEVSLPDGSPGYVFSGNLAMAGGGTGPVTTAPPSERLTQGMYAALAYSRSTTYYGIGYHAPTRAAAEQKAMEACGQRDCAILTWIQDGCVAISASMAGDVGYGSDPMRDTAERNSVKGCSQTGVGCKVIESICSED